MATVRKTFSQTVLRHAPRYFAAAFISSAVGFLMTKFYTTVFSPAEFGILALYATMLQYVILFASLSMDGGASRIYFDHRENSRNEYVSTMFWTFIVLSLVVFGSGLILMPFVVSLISAHTESIYITTLAAGIAAVFVSFFTRIFTNEQQSHIVAKYGILQTIVNHASSFALISFFRLGILGRQIGQAIGYLASIPLFLKDLWRLDFFRLRVVWNRAMAKETFLLSLPSVITVLQSLTMLYLDRVFLKIFYTVREVGIYSLGFMLGQGLSLVYEAISNALFPKVMEDLKNDYKKNILELERFAIKYYLGLVAITILVSLGSRWIVTLFSTPQYFEAIAVMPFVMSGFMMGGFYKIPSLVLGYHKVVWFYPALALFSLGVNGILNYFFIPKYAMVGAGFAMFAGVFIYSIVIQAMAARFHTASYRIKLFLLYGGICFAITVFFMYRVF